jgi:ketosteroid isomerase-like protein
MKKYLLLLSAIGFLCACNQQEPHHLSAAERKLRIDSLKANLLETDIAFSNLAEESGRNNAFLQYADSSAVMLRKWSKPVTGLNNIVGMLSNHADTAVKLSWMPIYADVSRAGDLGYTYGTYLIEHKDGQKHTGTYCTIWKRKHNTGWKFVLGTGNDGLKAEENEF